jgi:photosystem II stability/assembly factor-like uncharacterized protein
MRHRRLAACLLGIVLGAVACGRVSAIHAAASPLAHAARSPGKSLSGFQMFGERQGWGLGHGLIARTSDGARTFKDVTPANVGSISQDPSAFFLDADRAWVTSGNDTLDRTADGGATWTAIHMSPAIEGSVTFYDEQHGWLVQGQDTDQHTASLQTLWRTVDGGSTWTPVYRRTVRRSIEPHVQTGDCVWAATAWITSQHGLADVSCPFDSPPALEATDDGGSTWH